MRNYEYSRWWKRKATERGDWDKGEGNVTKRNGEKGEKDKEKRKREEDLEQVTKEDRKATERGEVERTMNVTEGNKNREEGEKRVKE